MAEVAIGSTGTGESPWPAGLSDTELRALARVEHDLAHDCGALEPSLLSDLHVLVNALRRDRTASRARSR